MKLRCAIRNLGDSCVIQVMWATMGCSSVMVVVCKTQSEPEKGEMLEKNHVDDDDYGCEDVTMSHEDGGNDG